MAGLLTLSTYVIVHLLLSSSAHGFTNRNHYWMACCSSEGRTKALDRIKANFKDGDFDGVEIGFDESANAIKQKRGQMNQKFLRAVSRENRMAVLEVIEAPSPSEVAELQGLRDRSLMFQEPYDPSEFSDEHIAFKKSHNQAFCALVHYCDQQRQRYHNLPSIPLFFLDGPDAATATALKSAGFSMDQCYVANRHETTCNALLSWGLKHVAHASASEALQDVGRSVFGHINFGAYYFDACGGHTSMIIDMLNASLGDRQASRQQQTVAVGFSLLGGNRDVVDKEVAIIQRLVMLAKGLDMRVHHVLDDPNRYGVDPSLRKVEGGTMTSWFILEADYCQPIR